MSEVVEGIRALADLVEANPALAAIPELFEDFTEPSRWISEHMPGAHAARIDQFAQALGADIRQMSVDGKHYTYTSAVVGGRTFRLQAYTEDYEQATGKTTSPERTAR